VFRCSTNEAREMVDLVLRGYLDREDESPKNAREKYASYIGLTPVMIERGSLAADRLKSAS
jgi:hypothetical protein